MTQYALPPKGLTRAKPALIFTNPIVLAYWREEIRLDCAVSLGRLRAICDSRGCDYAATVRAVGR